MTSSRATIRDVAAAAGVSPTTVSFVLNDTPGQAIPEATRHRVRSAVAQLGYTPHRIARALREGSSRLVLLRAGPLRGSASMASLIAGMDEELRRHGHALIVTYGTVEAERELLEAVAPRTVLDLVRIYGSGDSPQGDGGDVDGLEAHAAVQLGHLLELGHRSIAVALPADPSFEPLSSLRRRQLEAAAARAGATAIPIIIPREPSGAALALARLRAEHPRATAIAAFNDDVAFVVLAAMHAAGLSAPDDLAVVGFDEGEHAALWNPPLSSLRIDAAEFGRRAARRALGLDTGAWQRPPSQVVRRATT
ncbi:LacI family DNA-binding transcriptional regulator [Agrococcus citreus]|uniref:LacI family DNA-binding transcriptional regulator n=1 Tax=Agrococcus citreus TaxID=84643 RepID=A0ABN1YZ57_9MICO